MQLIKKLSDKRQLKRRKNMLFEKNI